MGEFKRFTKNRDGTRTLVPPKLGHQGAAFTKNAWGKDHRLRKLEGRNLDPSVPDLVQCSRCPRIVPEDMIVAYGGTWMCDGCWTDIRRRGLWDDSKVDEEPDA